MIEIKNLNISFGDKVILNNASFHTSPGVLTIIRGKSGSGKSTFLKTFQFAYECEYIYEGQRMDELDQESRQQFIYDHMVNVPVTKMLILLFFTAAFIIEFFIPTFIQMIMKKSKGTVMNR